ncbi:5622_t:CDS:2, partial [Diversispora eburnea]
GYSCIAILDEANVIMCQMGENVQVIDNKYQPYRGEIVKLFYDPDKSSEVIRKGFRILQEIYFDQMDGKQCQDDFANIDVTRSSLDCVIYTSTMEAGISFEISEYFDVVIGITNIATPVHIEAFAQMLFRICNCSLRIVSLYHSKKFDIFKDPCQKLIRAELSTLRLEDLPTAIKGQREWDKIVDCYVLNLSLVVETYIEVKYQIRLLVKYFPEILCSLIASTEVTLELISIEDVEKVNRSEVSHIIKNIEKKIKSIDAKLMVNASDISSDEAEILKQNSIRNIGDKNDIQDWGMNNDDWIKLCNIDFVKKFNNPEPLQYFRRLVYFRRQGSNVTNSIENLKIKEETQWEDSHDSTDLFSVDLHKFYLAKQWEAIHNLVQSIGFRDIDDTNILSEDTLLLFGFKTRAKGISDLNATIKFINAILDPILPPYNNEMSKERLKKWKVKILFEMRDNHNYWKKECKSMNEVAFLKYKHNFEIKLDISTTLHKKELKTRSLALIEYA